MKITFLGTGGSLGVPIVGCRCQVCESQDERNRRLRPSVWLRFSSKSVLIDVSPDYRQQALANNIQKVDAVLFTHAHADHCLGMDDLRIFIERQRSQLPVYGSEETLSKLTRIFGYLFDSKIWNTDLLRLSKNIVNGIVCLFGQDFMPIPVLHEDSWVLGWRFGNAAYVTDASEILQAAVEELCGLDLLVLNALRYEPHAKHFSVGQALEVIKRVQPRTAILTHMNHELEYNRLSMELPSNVSPAYDGLTVEL